jgi:hypothetical protein
MRARRFRRTSSQSPRALPRERIAAKSWTKNESVADVKAQHHALPAGGGASKAADSA